MKTLKSVKTFNISDEQQESIYLAMNISSEAQINSNVRFLNETNDLYYGNANRKDIYLGNMIDVIGKRLRIRHVFDFSGIAEDNLEEAMRHANITYNLLEQENKIFPFKKNTIADLDSQKRIVSVKVISLKLKS